MLYLLQEARDKEMMTDSLFLLPTIKGQEGALCSVESDFLTVPE